MSSIRQFQLGNGKNKWNVVTLLRGAIPNEIQAQKFNCLDVSKRSHAIWIKSSANKNNIPNAAGAPDWKQS